MVVTSEVGGIPKQNGDRYELTLKDENGKTLVDQALTVHYEHVTPTNCDNMKQVECTNGFMYFPLS